MNGTFQELMEKVFERNMRRFWDRNERIMPIWDVNSESNRTGVRTGTDVWVSVRTGEDLGGEKYAVVNEKMYFFSFKLFPWDI